MKSKATEERADQLARRQVKVTKQHNQEVRELLKLMGIPCVTVRAGASKMKRMAERASRK